jgi:hypothetical protein
VEDGADKRIPLSFGAEVAERMEINLPNLDLHSFSHTLNSLLDLGVSRFLILTGKLRLDSFARLPLIRRLPALPASQ